MTETAANWVKVLFPLEVGPDWPPVSAESAWATKAASEDEYQVRNIPFFAMNIAWGDTVRASPNADGALEVSEIVRSGGHFTIRIILMEGLETSEAVEELVRLGCNVERSPYPDLIAIDVPDEPTYALASELVHGWLGRGKVGVEEAKMP